MSRTKDYIMSHTEIERKLCEDDADEMELAQSQREIDAEVYEYLKKENEILKTMRGY